MKMDGHPLASKHGTVYVHRYVYYEAHGAGPFPCHWCQKEVTWKTLHIDHLNDVKLDNRPENLAATCAACNMKRGAPKARITRNETMGRFLVHQGERLTVSDWSRKTGLSTSAIRWRQDRGWPVGRILTQPKGKTGPKVRHD